MTAVKQLTMNLMFFLLGNNLRYASSEGEYLNYGPQYKATSGKLWPKPLWQDDTGSYYSVDPNNFQLVVINKNCPILQQAVLRYTKIIKDSAQGYNVAPNTPTVGLVQQLRINLTHACESLPHLAMDESYYIKGNGCITAKSIWGILRGLESLSQLLVPMSNGMLRLTDTDLYDAPRFKYRGLMLDTARHFITKKKILQLIEGMSYNKLNVFHWHITDDSAFPYKSNVFPELSKLGAYRPELTYSMADVKEIVEFARVRGIRIVAEFDTPAHTASWGASHPEIMTTCYGAYTGQLGPLNPTKESTFDFLYMFFQEIKTLFPEKYLHLGVDEVSSACWESNPQIQNYLAQNGLDNGDLPYLYLERFSANISRMGWKQMVWQEAMIENPWMHWPSETIAQVWFDYKVTMAKLTKDGQDVIMSDGWYLYVTDTGADWEKFYRVEPTNFTGTTAQKKRVLGGEACLWSEWLNENNILPTTFPRVSAVAERLWSEQEHRNEADARLRLEEHNCRMLFRGIEGRPANGFGIC